MSFWLISEVEESLNRAQSEEIRIPFGVGIAGHVAQMKEVVNIKDAYKASTLQSKLGLNLPKDPHFCKRIPDSARRLIVELGTRLAVFSPYQFVIMRETSSVWLKSSTRNPEIITLTPPTSR